MTRSPPANLPGGAARWLLLVVAAACGGRELSLGGDPVGLSVAQSGSAGALGGGATTGGSSGGPSAGGSGGTLVFGGGGGAAAGGAGGAGDDPYPPVTWQNGEGYRGVCPEYDGTSSFTCWHDDSGTTADCSGVGDSTCNACSCAIPCERDADCPSGASGEPAGCFGSNANGKSCFLTCEADSCPLGMACSTYPGTGDRVCAWLVPPVGMLPPVK